MWSCWFPLFTLLGGINLKRQEDRRAGNKAAYMRHLPSSVWVSHGHVARTAAWPDNPTVVRRRRTSTGTDVIIVTPGGRQRTPPHPAGRHSIVPTIATRPASSHGETSHESATAASFLEHGKTTVFVRFIIKVWVIRLCATFYRCLKRTETTALFSSRGYEMYKNKYTPKHKQEFHKCR